MPTNSQPIWETCKQLGPWLEVLQETTGNRKWFQDLKLLKLIRELESIDSLPPIAIVELKRGKIPICSDGEIQTFQERLNEANGLTSISLLVLRELTGELHTAIPIRARFRPSAFKPDGGLREKPANGVEANLARGIADDAGLSETLKHVKGILTQHSWDEQYCAPPPLVHTFAEWQKKLHWSSTTWNRRRKEFPECFTDVPGENACSISEPKLGLWLASAKSKQETPFDKT